MENSKEEKNKKQIPPAKVKGGAERQVNVQQKDIFRYVDTKGADLTKIKRKTRMQSDIKAPLKKGEKVGESVYYLNGKKIGTRDIVTQESVKKINYKISLENILEQYAL